MLAASSLPEDLAEPLIELIGSRDLRDRLGRRAYEFSRMMIWPEVGARYRRIFERVGERAGASHERSFVCGEEVGAGLA
jgi:hypothetical protein